MLSTSVDLENPLSRAGGPFSCSFCGKFFEKKPSRNRHVLYCRQKLVQQYHSRRKSCARCRHAKTRCDQSTPQCSRCKLKGLDCAYHDTPQTTLSAQLLEPEFSEPIEDSAFGQDDLSIPQVSASSCMAQESAIDGRNADDTGDIPVNLEIAPIDSWNDLLLTSALEGVYPANPHNTTLTSLHNQPSDAYLDHDIDLSWSSLEQDSQSNGDCQIRLMSQNRSLSPRQVGDPFFSRDTMQTSSMLSMPSSVALSEEIIWRSPILATNYVNSRGTELNFHITPARGLLVQRQRSFGSQLGCDYLLRTLRSYPKVMLSDTLPPFIHQKCGGPDSDLISGTPTYTQVSLAEPLAICKSIVHLYFTRSRETGAFIWRTIDMELNRLYNEYSQFDDWNLIAGLQALAIYIILAIIDEDSFRSSLDVKLLFTMTAIAARAEESNYLPNNTQYAEWQEWILLESRNRVFSLLFIINAFFDINPGYHHDACNAISKVPLPANRSLWEATTYVEWERKYTSWAKKREGRPSLTYGDMVSLQQKSQTSKDPRLDDLNDWYLNVDAFGTFVLMAATSI